MQMQKIMILHGFGASCPDLRTNLFLLIKIEADGFGCPHVLLQSKNCVET